MQATSQYFVKRSFVNRS
jgi:hypothetical protein